MSKPTHLKGIKLILAVTIALTLSSCSALNSVAQKGAEANDRAVEVAVFTLCQGASIGAVKRKFNTPEKADTLSELCAI